MSKESALVDRLKNLKEDDRENVKETLQHFSKYIVNNKLYRHVHLLKVLKDTINRFPKYCMYHRDTFERFLAQYIDNHHVTTVVCAAQCVLALQQVRPVDNKDSTPKSSWKSHMRVLCMAAYKIMVTIFGESVTNVYKHISQYDVELENCSEYGKALCDIQTGSDKNWFANLSRRLSNIFLHIQVMLVDSYPVAKSIVPKMILVSITQILNATNIHCPLIDDKCLEICKIQALRTIDALVVSLHTNLIPFNHLILRLLMQVLRGENNTTQITVRVKTYDSIQKWLTVLHSYIPEKGGSGNCDFESQLVVEITNDVKRSEPILQLGKFQMPNASSKKNRRRLMEINLQECNLNQEPEIQINEEPVNEEVKVAALKCLQTFILVCGYFMQPEKYEMISKLIIMECFKCDEHSEDKAYLFCTILDTLRKSASPKVQSLIHYCLQIFSVLTSSKYYKISTLATNALLDIRIQLINSPPSLSYPNNALNRAALEELLGPNGIYPPKDGDDDDIEVNEPANKKLKTNHPEGLNELNNLNEMFIEQDDNTSEDYSLSEEEEQEEMVVEEEETPPQQAADNTYETLPKSEANNNTADINIPVVELEINDLADSEIGNNIGNNFLNELENTSNLNLSDDVTTFNAPTNVDDYFTQEPPTRADNISLPVYNNTISPTTILNTDIPTTILNTDPSDTILNTDPMFNGCETSTNSSGFCANITRIAEITTVTTIRSHYNTESITKLTLQIDSKSQLEEMLADFVDE